jgi:hypothetical protein
METTRTPSVLSKVSVWTVVMMGVSDSWIFSAHVVMGILSDNKTSIALLVPGFLGLCSAVVFGPVSFFCRSPLGRFLTLSATPSYCIESRRQKGSFRPRQLRLKWSDQSPSLIRKVSQTVRPLHPPPHPHQPTPPPRQEQNHPLHSVNSSLAIQQSGVS